MDYIDTEKKAKKLHELRKEMRELTKEINALTKEVKDYLKSENKSTMLFDNVSVALLIKKNRRVDYDSIEGLIKKGVLPENTITYRESETLKTASQKDVELKNNKWVKR